MMPEIASASFEGGGLIEKQQRRFKRNQATLIPLCSHETLASTRTHTALSQRPSHQGSRLAETHSREIYVSVSWRIAHCPAKPERGCV